MGGVCHPDRGKGGATGVCVMRRLDPKGVSMPRVGDEPIPQFVVEFVPSLQVPYRGRLKSVRAGLGTQKNCPVGQTFWFGPDK